MKSSFVLTLQHHHIGKQDPIAMDFKTWNMFWRLCFGVLATLIITGNILIIWIFFKLRRRKRSSFLLIGLGVADLLVGGLAIPLLIATYESASITVWRVFDLVDMFTSTSSIYALAVISVERMFAIGWPLRHRTANFRVYICAISIPWIIAAIFTFFHWCKLQLHYKWQRNLPSSFVSCNTSISYVCSVLCYLEETKITNM